MLLEFSELSNHFFTISDFFVVKQQGNGRTRFVMQNPRHTDAFILFANTTGICYQKNSEPLYIPKGSLVYMPKNSCYTWENSPAEGSRLQENILFEFTLNRADIIRDAPPKNKFTCRRGCGERIYFSDKVCIVTSRHFALYKQLLYSLLEIFESDAEPLSVYCAAYDFFSTLSANCRIEEKNNSNIRIIKNSIRYLEDSSVSPKSIKEIAESCNISIGYYERIFRDYTGVSPLEYRNIHRINIIKMFLLDPDITLNEIAERIGYCDSGYLCRIFKTKTGMTPKEYRNIYLKQTQKSFIK